MFNKGIRFFMLTAMATGLTVLMATAQAAAQGVVT
jgi:hypothetical protein